VPCRGRTATSRSSCGSSARNGRSFFLFGDEPDRNRSRTARSIARGTRRRRSTWEVHTARRAEALATIEQRVSACKTGSSCASRGSVARSTVPSEPRCRSLETEIALERFRAGAGRRNARRRRRRRFVLRRATGNDGSARKRGRTLDKIDEQQRGREGILPTAKTRVRALSCSLRGDGSPRRETDAGSRCGVFAKVAFEEGELIESCRRDPDPGGGRSTPLVAPSSATTSSNGAAPTTMGPSRSVRLALQPHQRPNAMYVRKYELGVTTLWRCARSRRRGDHGQLPRRVRRPLQGVVEVKLTQPAAASCRPARYERQSRSHQQDQSVVHQRRSAEAEAKKQQPAIVLMRRPLVEKTDFSGSSPRTCRRSSMDRGRVIGVRSSVAEHQGDE